MKNQQHAINCENEKALKVLFIGNSATYMNELPQTLEKLATLAGYKIVTNSATKGGYTLARHVKEQTVFDIIAAGQYDVVFLQENSNSLYSDSESRESRDAHKELNTAIRQTGAKTYLYVRPPVEKEKHGENSVTQCIRFDHFFGNIAAEIGAEMAYVNRAFAYAIEHHSFPLWGPDHAHTGVYGGYLAVCVFFATLFHTSATVLDANGLPTEDAKILQQIADKIALEELIPW